MIKDGEIDLTVDMKFGREEIFNSPPEFDLSQFHKIPWESRPVESGDWQAHYKRMNGDRFSDDFGYTIRRCLDGSWFVTNGCPQYLVDAYLYENYIQEPSLFVECPSCGKYWLSKDKYLTCPECEDSHKTKTLYDKIFPTNTVDVARRYTNTANYIPWEDAHRDWKTREFHHPLQVLEDLK